MGYYIQRVNVSHHSRRVVRAHRSHRVPKRTEPSSPQNPYEHRIHNRPNLTHAHTDTEYTTDLTSIDKIEAWCRAFESQPRTRRGYVCAPTSNSLHAASSGIARNERWSRSADAQEECIYWVRMCVCARAGTTSHVPPIHERRPSRARRDSAQNAGRVRLLSHTNSNTLVVTLTIRRYLNMKTPPATLSVSVATLDY